jgi:hypothetical protein
VARDRDGWSRLFSDYGACAKLFRRQFLEDHDITFPEGRNFEDNSFVVDAYFAAERIGVWARPTYFYRRYRRAQGGTRSTTTDRDSFHDQVAVLGSIVRRHRLQQAGSRRELAADAVVKKLAAEVARFGHAEWTFAAIREQADLAALVDARGGWSSLKAARHPAGERSSSPADRRRVR